MRDMQALDATEPAGPGCAGDGSPSAGELLGGPARVGVLPAAPDVPKAPAGRRGNARGAGEVARKEMNGEPKPDGRKRPMTVHTVKSLLAKSEEEGECKLWTGYHGGNHGETPYVFHDGRMEPVRRLMARLLGKEVLPGHFWGCTCGNHSCIEPRHAIQRSHREHTQNMARIAAESPSHKGRIAKLTVIRQAMASLDAERAAEIRSSTESGVLLAARYGVSRQTVNAIRRGERWKDRGNPFAGLGA